MEVKSVRRAHKNTVVGGCKKTDEGEVPPREVDFNTDLALYSRISVLRKMSTLFYHLKAQMATKELLFKISSRIPQDFHFNNMKSIMHLKEYGNTFFHLKSSSSFLMYGEIWAPVKISTLQLSWIISNVLHDKSVSVVMSTFQMR